MGDKRVIILKQWWFLPRHDDKKEDTLYENDLNYV